MFDTPGVLVLEIARIGAVVERGQLAVELDVGDAGLARELLELPARHLGRDGIDDAIAMLDLASQPLDRPLVRSARTAVIGNDDLDPGVLAVCRRRSSRRWEHRRDQHQGHDERGEDAACPWASSTAHVRSPHAASPYGRRPFTVLLASGFHKGVRPRGSGSIWIEPGGAR